MILTESQLRRLIRAIIRESVADEHHGDEEDHSSEEEPMGDESRVKKVYTIAKEVSSFL